MSTTATLNFCLRSRSATRTFGASPVTFTVKPNDRHDAATNCAAAHVTGFVAFVVVITSNVKTFFDPGACHLPLTLRQPPAFSNFAARMVSYDIGRAAVLTNAHDVGGTNVSARLP